MDSGKITFFKYVPNGFVHLWQEAGWEAIYEVFDGTHHGQYSTFMQWTGDGEPICPRSEEAA